eukprot:4462695-Amphidinium_carterae.1
MRGSIEQLVSEQLGQQDEAAPPSVQYDMVRTDVHFSNVRSLGAVLEWAEQKLSTLRSQTGRSLCVLCAPLSMGELRGVEPSSYVEQKYSRKLAALRDMPVCCAPFREQDASFPTLDWVMWAAKIFYTRIPALVSWWRRRLVLCRIVKMPICNLPETMSMETPAALDVMFARQLENDSQISWASARGRPDLGQTALALIDAQED